MPTRGSAIWCLALGLLAGGCQLVTEDYETVDWFERYEDGQEVAGADFCYDFYSVLCFKLRECYPDSPYHELTNEECAREYYDEYCGAGIYQNNTLAGEAANACLDAIAEWRCLEVDAYLQGGALPPVCQSALAD